MEKTTIDVTWLDPVNEGWRYSYKITAVDFAGNESDPASPGTVTSVAESQVPMTFELYQNIPNPSNRCKICKIFNIKKNS